MLDDPFHSHADDVSVFETAADFFSIVALAAIYVLIAFTLPQQIGTPVSASLDANSPDAPGSNAPITARLAVTVVPTDDGFFVEIRDTPGGEFSRQHFDNTEKPINVTAWVLSRVQEHPNTMDVSCELPPGDHADSIFKVFFNVLRSLRAAGYRVVMS